MAHMTFVRSRRPDTPHDERYRLTSRHLQADGVLTEVTAWQSRPLEAVYTAVFFDALRVKIREDAIVRNKAVYLALGIRRDDSRDILGIWIENTEGAKFWLKVFNDLKNRGLADMLIAVTDGLKGMPEASSAVYPQTTLQTCIVHLIRNSLDYASWKDRRARGQPCVRSIRRRMRTPHLQHWMTLRRALGEANFRPWWQHGAGHGSGSFRSLPFRPASPRDRYDERD